LANITDIKETIVNVSGATARVVTALVNGQPIKVTQDVLDQRMRICSACKHNRLGRCVLCHCYINLKQALTTEGCPAGMWDSTK
jgi:hypothetical protein